MQIDRRQAATPSAPTAAAPATTSVGSTSPLGSVANFGGGTESLGNPRAISTGGSGFGFQPDLSGASPEQLKRFTDTLSHLVYSVPAGGYITQDEAQNANSWYNKFGTNSGGNPGANKAAHDIYGEIGGFPTKAIGTPALTRLQSDNPGLPVSHGPSFNDRLGALPNNPFGPTYEGPYAIPGY